MTTLVFQKARARNLLSVGSGGIEYKLNQHHITMLVGKNGAGKSLLLDTLCLGLYGKPYRPINKAQLINSINGKECLVEIEFTADGVAYKVIRGLKPNVFEIYCNGLLLNQDAASRDYQKVLEQQILKMSFKSFTQICVMGPAGYVPFMNLKVGERRDVIEELLDIKVFATMADILKQHVDETKSRMNHLNTSIKSKKDSLVFQERVVEQYEQDREVSIQNITKDLIQAQSEYDQAQGLIDSLQLQANRIPAPSDDLSDKLRSLGLYRKKIEGNASKTYKHAELLASADACPTCLQSITEQHSAPLIEAAHKQVDEFNRAIESLDTKVEEINQQIEIQNANDAQIRKLSAAVSDQHVIARTAQSQITALEKKLEQEKSNQTDSSTDAKAALANLAKEIMRLMGNKKELMEKKSLEDVAGFLLKDSGIKTSIIKQYIPTLNQLINQYLEVMDMFVSFELDEQFNETVRSRHRDTFSFANFSEGEKARINVAILFAWRELARHRASVNVNLLILDELLDASTDYDGLSGITNILYDTRGTNIWLISHNASWGDRFGNTVTITKQNNYSVMEAA